MEDTTKEKDQSLRMSKRPPPPATAAAPSKRKKPPGNHPKTLGSLLKYMEGMEVIVELKTGKRIRGNLLSADNDMNVTLENPQKDAAEKEEDEIELLDNIHIRGSTVRLIQFPDNADLHGTIAAGVEKEKAAANKYKRGKRK